MCHADLFLDTFPYTAHTTALDALRAGVLLLTLVGNSFVSRVAGSLLNTLGLSELITSSVEEYHRRAVELATDRDRSIILRNVLSERRRTSKLFPVDQFARGLEAAFRMMWVHRT
jgi:predicted O-linked N-acetylglucosamine transferase (SPINDLY family)